MNRQAPLDLQLPARPIPISALLDRILVGAVAALVVARPLVTGADPGRLRLISGSGPVSFNLCLLIVLFLAGVWRLAYATTHPARCRMALTCLALVGIGVLAFISSRQGDRYARPGLFISWEWIAIAVAVFLTRRVTASANDSRGLLNVLLASAVSVGGLGVYQSLMAPLHLPSLDVVGPDLQSNLVGNDEFYPELNRPPFPPKATRGTFDSPATLLMFLFLTLPAALAIARAGRSIRRGRLLLFVPGILAIAAAAALLANPFDETSGAWSAARRLIEQYPLLGIGPGNFSRMVPNSSPPHSAWLGLAATTGMVALALFMTAVAVAIWQAWPVKASATTEGRPATTRWEFQLGGAAGLVLGFIWAFGEVPAEARASEVFTLGAAAVFRAILWFAAFGLLEMARPSSRSLGKAILVGSRIRPRVWLRVRRARPTNDSLSDVCHARHRRKLPRQSPEARWVLDAPFACSGCVGQLRGDDCLSHHGLRARLGDDVGRPTSADGEPPFPRARPHI